MRKRCKRKVWGLIDPIKMAIEGACVTGGETLEKLQLDELSAIDAMKRGLGTKEDWRVLADMMNIAIMMGKNGIGAEVLPCCEQVQQSLHKAALRYESTGVMGLDGPGIKAISDLYEYHDLQRTSVARSVYEEMIQKTHKHLKAKHKDVVVV